MYVIEAVLASIGLSFDVLALSMREGSLVAKIDKKKVVYMCLIFGFVQILAMQLGILITNIPIFNSQVRELQVLWHILSGVIILGIGAYMLYKGFKKENLVERLTEISLKNIFVIAILASIDALFAGISFGILDIRAIITILVLFIITVISVIIGVIIGYRLGYEQKEKAYLGGGILLFISGIMYLVRYF